MKRLRVLITAGPTREPIDPVRFLSNRSSGKMGYALANAAARAGHRVTLVSGPVGLVPPRIVRVIPVETARAMRTVVLRKARRADLIIMAAAVADYEPVSVARQKIKKRTETLTLRLRKTPDILAELGRRKKPGQVLVGFAAETSRLREYAHAKLQAKNLDYVVANRIGVKGSGFESDYNRALVIGREGIVRRFVRMTKLRLARQLVKFLLNRLLKKSQWPRDRALGRMARRERGAARSRPWRGQEASLDRRAVIPRPRDSQPPKCPAPNGLHRFWPSAALCRWGKPAAGIAPPPRLAEWSKSAATRPLPLFQQPVKPRRSVALQNGD